jgi:hypothetical protein
MIKKRQKMDKMTYEIGKLRMERFLEESREDSYDAVSQKKKTELPALKRFSLNLQRSLNKLV